MMTCSAICGFVSGFRQHSGFITESYILMCNQISEGESTDIMYTSFDIRVQIFHDILPTTLFEKTLFI
jgi:hypothetical protein